MEFLKNVPDLILIGSAVLTLIAIYFGGRMHLEARRLRNQFATLRNTWAAIEPPTREERGYGLDGRRFAEVQAKCKQVQDAARKWWLAVDEAFDRYTSPEEREGWFVTKPLREILPDSLIGRKFHAAFYSAFPGILTGSGLMLTFVAILLALIGVHYNGRNPAEPVIGIGGFINGLSGKFLSSIVALALSVLFTFAEKELCDGCEDRMKSSSTPDNLFSLISRPLTSF